MAAEARRPGGGLRHAADRQIGRRAPRQADRSRRPGGTAARAREHGADRDARSAAAPQARLARAPDGRSAERHRGLASAQAGGEEGAPRALPGALRDPELWQKYDGNPFLAYNDPAPSVE